MPAPDAVPHPRRPARASATAIARYVTGALLRTIAWSLVATAAVLVFAFAWRGLFFGGAGPARAFELALPVVALPFAALIVLVALRIARRRFAAG